MYRDCNPFWRKIGSIFLVAKALTQVPKVPASSKVWGYGSPWNHEILQIWFLLKWQFLHFRTIFVVFYKVFIIITDIFGFFFAVVNPMFRKRETSFAAFTSWPLWKIIINLPVMCARHKCIQLKATLVWALFFLVISSQTL